MPFNDTTKVFGRIWRFIDQFASSEAVRRADFDTAIDDISDGINDTSGYLKGLIDAVSSAELYLGTKMAPPALNNQGNALVAGNYYVLAPDYVLFVYDGDAWVTTTDLPPATPYFKTLPSASNAEALRGLLEMGTAAVRSSDYFATAVQLAAQQTTITAQAASIAALQTSLANAGGIPVGTVVPVAGPNVPNGLLMCDGTFRQRVGTYAPLFEQIGKTYGAGNGTTNFRLPDLRGEFIRGWDNGRGVDDGRVLGTRQSDEIASHTHNVNITLGTTDTTRVSGTADGGSGNSGYATTAQATGGDETRPRNVALMYCIKY